MTANLWHSCYRGSVDRISFQGRVRFAGVARVRKDALVLDSWLKHRIDSPRFSKVHARTAVELDLPVHRRTRRYRRPGDELAQSRLDVGMQRP